MLRAQPRESRQNGRRLRNYGTKRYVLRYASAENSRKRKGFVCTVSRGRAVVSLMGAFPLGTRLVDILECARDLSAGRFLRTCILHIHIYKICTYIFVMYTKIQYVYMMRARFIVRSINARVSSIPSNPKVICAAYPVCRIHTDGTCFLARSKCPL